MPSLLARLGVVITLLWVAPLHAQDDPRRIEALRVGSHPDRTRIVLDADGPIDYRLSRLKGPERVVLDVENAVIAFTAENHTFDGTAVLGVRHTRRSGNGLRIVLDLSQDDLSVRRFALGPDGEAGRGYRLVLDLFSDSAAIDSVATVTPAALHQDSVTTSSSAGNVQGLPAEAETETVKSEAKYSGPTEKSVDDDLADFFSVAQDDGSSGSPQLTGYFEASAARTFADPEHWSKMRSRLELALTGDIGDSVRFKLATRFDADVAYVVEDDFYPGAVRDDQRFEAQIREFYLDFGDGPWTHRVGRQHIVWGEMVGLFLADVVSARDTREFFLQDFEAMRIPQWAWNTQYFSGDTTLELVYIPFQSVDNIGEPGADFYPFPLPGGTPVRDERPDRDLSNFNWGLRGSTLIDGWSLSAYYYDSVSVAPTLVAGPDVFSLQYDDLEQIGGTFSKDLGAFIFKGEAVYVRDRRFQSVALEDPRPLPSSASLDWVVGTTIPLGDWRVDLQLYGRSTPNHDPRMGFDADEFGSTLLVNYAASSRLEFEVLALAGLNREDYLIRPKVAWRFAKDWRLQAGADVFGGDEIGLFGPYDNRDRIYLEVKRWF